MPYDLLQPKFNEDLNNIFLSKIIISLSFRLTSDLEKNKMTKLSSEQVESIT